jgi:DinB superfamily
MPIEPDTKDWTWVLARPCPECGYVAADVDRARLGALVRDNAAAWQAVLARPEGLADRPSGDRWSALEYAGHIEDVYRIMDARLALMLAEDDPAFANWDQDETAEERRYGEADPPALAAALGAAAAVLADRYDAVAGPTWDRTGRRSDGATFTVDSLGRYMLHDLVHHLDDVARGFAVLGVDRG